MAKKAVILMNLGSPDSCETKNVRTYLKEFLMDERVIDIPPFQRGLLVKGIIAPFRAPKSAEAYQSVWMKEGSPLIVFTQQLQRKVQAHTDIPTYIAMRYGSYAPNEVYIQIKEEHPEVEEVLLIPLYPHYTMSSFETAALYAETLYQKGNYSFRLRILKPFFNHPHYIKALAASIKPHLTDHFDLLLFSYHGIPERHIMKEFPERWESCTGCVICTHDDRHERVCYKHQCKHTTALAARELGLAPEQYRTTFQSRLGRSEWLKPYTANQLTLLPKAGIKKLLVVCPAFVSDCLETLEEIGMQGKNSFMENGGTSFEAIPCMNTSAEWVNTLSAWITQADAAEKEMWANSIKEINPDVSIPM